MNSSDIRCRTVGIDQLSLVSYLSPRLGQVVPTDLGLQEDSCWLAVCFEVGVEVGERLNSLGYAVLGARLELHRVVDTAYIQV